MNSNNPTSKTHRHPARWLVFSLAWFATVPAYAQKAYSPNNPSIGPSTTLTYEGFTEPIEDILLAADELGRIDSIDVSIGDSVEAGQVIGKLEDTMQQIAVELAGVQVAMVGELNATKAEVELNRSRTIQIRQLIAEEMARPDELARAETDLQIAIARHTAAIEQNALRKVELRRYELQLERRKVKAPRAGVIADVFHHPGEYITPADPSIVHLMAIDKLYAVFPVPVEDMNAIQDGQVVRLYFRSRSITLQATITSIAPNISRESGTVQVRCELDNSDRELLAGDHFVATILFGKRVGPAQASAPPVGNSRGKSTKR